MICSKCGKHIDYGVKNCPSCKSKISYALESNTDKENCNVLGDVFKYIQNGTETSTISTTSASNLQIRYCPKCHQGQLKEYPDRWQCTFCNYVENKNVPVQKPVLIESEPEEDKTKICPRCGKRVPEEWDVCKYCRHVFNKKCPNCNADIPDEAQVCPKCGYRFYKTCIHCKKSIPAYKKKCPNCGKNPDSKSNKFAIIAISAAVALAAMVLAGAILFVTSHKPNNPVESVSDTATVTAQVETGSNTEQEPNLIQDNTTNTDSVVIKQDYENLTDIYKDEDVKELEGNNNPIDFKNNYLFTPKDLGYDLQKIYAEHGNNNPNNNITDISSLKGNYDKLEVNILKDLTGNDSYEINKDLVYCEPKGITTSKDEEDDFLICSNTGVAQIKKDNGNININIQFTSKTIKENGDNDYKVVWYPRYDNNEDINDFISLMVITDNHNQNNKCLFLVVKSYVYPVVYIGYEKIDETTTEITTSEEATTEDNVTDVQDDGGDNNPYGNVGNGGNNSGNGGGNSYGGVSTDENNAGDDNNSNNDVTPGSAAEDIPVDDNNTES